MTIIPSMWLHRLFFSSPHTTTHTHGTHCLVHIRTLLSSHTYMPTLFSIVHMHFLSKPHTFCSVHTLLTQSHPHDMHYLAHTHYTTVQSSPHTLFAQISTHFHSLHAHFRSHTHDCSVCRCVPSVCRVFVCVWGVKPRTGRSLK